MPRHCTLKKAPAKHLTRHALAIILHRCYLPHIPLPSPLHKYFQRHAITGDDLKILMASHTLLLERGARADSEKEWPPPDTRPRGWLRVIPRRYREGCFFAAKLIIEREVAGVGRANRMLLDARGICWWARLCSRWNACDAMTNHLSRWGTLLWRCCGESENSRAEEMRPLFLNRRRGFLGFGGLLFEEFETRSKLAQFLLFLVWECLILKRV